MSGWGIGLLINTMLFNIIYIAKIIGVLFAEKLITFERWETTFGNSIKKRVVSGVKPTYETRKNQLQKALHWKRLHGLF
jgi:hypothetical protein